jgi:methylmalonyl-CoA/ethylmalonyl-CoA epimerase
MSQITGIAQIALSVRDMDRATKFYRDTLGLRFLFSPSPQMAFFDCGGIRLLLGTQGGEPGARSTLVYLKVADIQAAHEAMTSRGATFEQAPHVVARLPDREIWIALLNDPDGNPLHLMSEVPQKK